jgi:hypothetical protein
MTNVCISEFHVDIIASAYTYIEVHDWGRALTSPGAAHLRYVTGCVEVELSDVLRGGSATAPSARSTR